MVPTLQWGLVRSKTFFSLAYWRRYCCTLPVLAADSSPFRCQSLQAVEEAVAPARRSILVELMARRLQRRAKDMDAVDRQTTAANACDMVLGFLLALLTGDLG